MNSKEIRVLVIVSVVVLGIILLEIQRTRRETPVTDPNVAVADGYRGVTAKRLQEMIGNREDILLIDVRRPEEFKEEHIPGAINMSVSNIGETVATIDRSRQIVLYCKSGPWSRQAYKVLKDKGFERIAVLNNGIVGWKWELNGEVIASP